MKKILNLIGVSSLAVFLMPLLVSAHVRFIAGETELMRYGGSDFPTFFQPLSERGNVLMILVTILVTVVVYWISTHSRRLRHWYDHMEQVGFSYKNLIPWIARLSVGIALIGFGSAGALMSPVISGTAFFSFAQMFLGFMLLAGFLVGPMAMLVILLFIVAFTKDFYLLGSLDLLALVFTLNILDDRRPGVDDILNIKDYARIPALEKFVPTILRIGVGFSFAFLALYEKVLNPNLTAWVAEFTDLTNVIPVSAEMWTFASGAIELILGILLIIGLRTRLVSAISLMVLSLSFFYFGEDVTSHITLFGSLSAVFALGGGLWSLDRWIYRRSQKQS